MDPGLNPYRPGAGLQPPELTGRDAQIKEFDFLVIRAKHRTVDRPMVMSGLRGVGKTALLNKLAGMAEQAHWITVVTEGQTTNQGVANVRRRLGAEINAALLRSSMGSRMKAGMRKLGALVSAFSLTLGPTELSFAPKPAATGLLDVDVETLVLEIASSAREDERAFAIFIDEMQDIEPELLSAFIVAQHRAQQKELPFYVIGTGLPNLPTKLSSARSYAERLFSYSVIGPLDRQASLEALVLPAERFGATYTLEAAEFLVEASNGYPYFLQEYGKAIWDLASDRTFTLADAKNAIVVGQAQLDAGFFPARWDRASEKERAYMVAMTKNKRTASVAASLAKTMAELSSVRQSLINKGLIYVPQRGEVAFTVPGMADFIDRATAQ
ncbi:MAG: ATP-binding protein [Propionibacteriaceae bacterium]|jgi:hypothetical protein|nr:ATP-binding protein [Propionibacteriaceae bacterium]